MRRFLAAALAVTLAVGVAAAATETVTVIVRRASIRSDRQFYAPTLVEGELGESFAVQGRQKGWVKVTTKSGEGWLHESAVTTKKVTASAAPAAGGRVVEREYRKKNPTANFAAVDRMEKLAANDRAVTSFVRDGHIQPREARK